MKLTVRSICGKYNEVFVDEIHSGTLDSDESFDLAKDLLLAAADLLWGADFQEAADSCERTLSELSEVK